MKRRLEWTVSQGSLAAETLLPLGVAMFLGGVLGWERESARKPADTDLGSRAGGRRFLLWGLLAVAIVLVMIWLVWGFRRPPTAALFTGASGSIGRCHVGKTDFLRLAG